MIAFKIVHLAAFEWQSRTVNSDMLCSNLSKQIRNTIYLNSKFSTSCIYTGKGYERRTKKTKDRCALGSLYLICQKGLVENNFIRH